MASLRSLVRSFNKYYYILYYYSESRAINRYLAHKYNDVGTDLLRLNSLKESTIVDMWMEVEAHQFSGPITQLVRQMIINAYYGRLPDEKVVEVESEKLAKVLDVYEERLSKCKYLAGEYFTMADLNHLPYLFLFMRTPKASLVTSRPNVCAWWNDISSRPTSIKVLEGLKY
ncbi:Glutathione S-transferase [Macleaya cordata]|uniref:glutathione transferase n=1 Tax=Macleaya cordata TaxID=56857 RepID=A0A200Q1H9_MACCD|nr:Glutathione S-transferase [Macleaya cordata]